MFYMSTFFLLNYLINSSLFFKLTNIDFKSFFLVVDFAFDICFKLLQR